MSGTLDIIIQPAEKADATEIKRIVRSAGINPFGLVWQRFLVAVSDGQIVATGQLKPHRDGTLEVASIATLPTYQHKGVAGQIIHALLERQPGPLYLECESSLESFYRQFGFRALAPAEMPPSLGWQYRMVMRFKPLINIMMRGDFNLSIMKLDR